MFKKVRTNNKYKKYISSIGITGGTIGHCYYFSNYNIYYDSQKIQDYFTTSQSTRGQKDKIQKDLLIREKIKKNNRRGQLIKHINN